MSVAVWEWICFQKVYGGRSWYPDILILEIVLYTEYWYLEVSGFFREVLLFFTHFSYLPDDEPVCGFPPLVDLYLLPSMMVGQFHRHASSDYESWNLTAQLIICKPFANMATLFLVLLNFEKAITFLWSYFIYIAYIIYCWYIDFVIFFIKCSDQLLIFFNFK